MQINNNQLSSSQLQSTERPLELKKGDVVTAQVKEIKSKNEAVLQIRGKEVLAQFEGEIPGNTGDKVTIQVTGKNDQSITAKAVEVDSTSKTQSQQNNTTILQNLGITAKDSNELQQAVKTLLDKGIPLTKENVQDLRTFFEKAQGTVQQKLESVKALANKNLEVTLSHLTSIHEALNGRPVSGIVQEIAKELNSDYKDLPRDLRNLISQVRNTDDLQKINQLLKANVPLDKIKNYITNLVRQSQAEVENLFVSTKALAGDAGSNNDSITENLLNNLIKQFQKEANLTKGLEQLKEQLSNTESLTEPIKVKLETSINKAIDLHTRGRELGARQEIINTLTSVMEDIQSQQVTIKEQEPQVNQSNVYDEQLGAFQLSSKDIIVTRVTQKLAELTQDFKETKRDITRNLDNIQRLLEQPKVAPQQTKQLLESTIKKLDNTILKSDIMLFTDMKTEKDLLKASGQLAEAKKYLSKGEQAKAYEIVQNVKTAIDKMIFKPADVKVMHFISKEIQSDKNTALISQLTEVVSKSQLTEPSARQMFDILRNNGLSHENELAQKLVFKQSDGSQQFHQQQDPNQQNMKSILLRLLGNEVDGQNGKVQQLADQALSNITGQQLLSKSDSNSNLQTLLLNLPIMLENQTENVKVFINSRNQTQQLDWENCSLYFLIETKKLGEVGILINSTDRNLSVTLKNDKVDFQQKMEPVIEVTKQKLKEIGYNVGNIQFAKMSEAKKETSNKLIDNTHESTRPKPIFTGKGMDFKI